MKRPESHRTGDLGEIRTTQLFAEYGWIVTKVQSDYGIDLIIQRTEGQLVTGDFALVQVKATRRPFGGGAASISLSRRHLDLWQAISIPTFLAVVDVPTNEAFILDCHALSLQLTQGRQANGSNPNTHTVTIPQAALIEIKRMEELSRCVQVFWARIRQARKTHTAIPFSSGMVATTSFIGIGAVPLSLPTFWGPIGALIGGVVGALPRGSSVWGGELVSRLRAELSPVLGSVIAEELVCEALQDPIAASASNA